MQFLVPIEREVKRVNKNGKEITKTISYKLKFVDNARFMASSLSNLVNSLTKRIHKIKCKSENDNKICETCRIKNKDFVRFPESTNFKDDLIEHKCLCLCYNQNFPKKLDGNFKKRFYNT